MRSRSRRLGVFQMVSRRTYDKSWCCLGLVLQALVVSLAQSKTAIVKPDFTEQ